MDPVALIDALFNSGGIMGAIAAIVIVVGAVWRFYFMPKSTSAKPAPPVGQGLSARVTAIEARMTKVEHQIEHLPTRDELHELEKAMVGLAGKIQAIESTTQATNHAVTRIENFLLELSKK